MRHTIRVSIATIRGDLDVDACWEQDGLAVTRSVEWREGWSVTHCESGYRVLGSFEQQNLAQSVATRLLNVGDWKRSRTILQQDKAMGAAFKVLKEVLVAEGVRIG